MDERYTKVRGSWVYLYRALDKTGRTVDFFLNRNRDVNSAKAFLRNGMKNRRTPTKITLDAYAASRSAGNEGDWRTSAPSKSAIKPILEQSRGNSLYANDKTEPFRCSDGSGLRNGSRLRPRPQGPGQLAVPPSRVSGQTLH